MPAADWAPYSNETTGRTPKGIRTFSKGLVQSVYLSRVSSTSAFITAVKPLVTPLFSYPTSPLASAGAWRVDVVVYLRSHVAVSGTLTASPAFGAPVALPATLPGGDAEVAVNVSLSVAPGAVELWWPNTVAVSRPLYAINVSFAPAGGGAPVATARRVGFRTIALATADDSDPAALAGVPGSGAVTMRLKINGADVFARGANWIPLEELHARETDAAAAAAVASAAAASMNILRVWGGGTYPGDALLDACDAEGVLLFIDAMYASQDNSHHFALDTPEQRAELRHHVRRMAAHPSVALLDGGNELGGSGPYEDFVTPIMAKEDPTRPIWPASPSAGWQDGVDRLWGLPLPGHALRILTAPAPVAPVAGCDCQGQEGVFYYGFPLTPFLDPVPVADAAACCALCEATPGCAAGNYQSGGCQLIEPPFAPLPRDASWVAVWPPATAAGILPVPAPNKAEAHGPYQGGGGWPTVNGGGPPARAFDAQLPPVFAPAATGYGTAAPGGCEWSGRKEAPHTWTRERV